jgi:phosphoribosyl 1,2-cyclic phosphodiesterase
MSNLSIKFYGTRGSIPICDPEMAEFGGNTTCIAFYRKKNNRLSIMDAGTGIRNLGKEMKQSFGDQKDLSITFSHFHWDHIQGFPFFDPAYDPEMSITIQVLGKEMASSDLRQIFAQQMMEDYFPVPLHRMGATFHFEASADNLILGDDVILNSIAQYHPGGSLGFRVEVDGVTFVVCTDHEHGDQVEEKYVEFARGADVLIHDAQYTTEELTTHKGWGHSSYEQCMELAERAGVERLYFTHHDPDHNDDFLRQMEKKCQDRFKNSFMAREGMEIQL